jgi:hypothetical protein
MKLITKAIRKPSTRCSISKPSSTSQEKRWRLGSTTIVRTCQRPRVESPPPRYEKNLLAYSDAAWKSEASLLLLDGVQAFLLNGGLLLGLLLAAKNIIQGTNSLGNIILVNSYLLQVF